MVAGREGNGVSLDAALIILEDLGLSEKEARVLAALVAAGSATAAHLAGEADLYRTNVYPVLESLEAKGLVGRLPGKAGAWSSAGPDRVVDRLYAAEERRHDSLQARRDELRGSLTAPPKANDAVLPRVDLVLGPSETARTYDAMLRKARREVLVFNRAPYGESLDDPSGAIVEMLARRVETRVLYRTAELDDAVFREEAGAYLAAGVQARVTDELPTKLVVVDRRIVLVALITPDDPEDSFPVSQYAESAGFAAPWAAAFEHYWATSTPVAEAYNLSSSSRGRRKR